MDLMLTLILLAVQHTPGYSTTAANSQELEQYGPIADLLLPLLQTNAQTPVSNFKAVQVHPTPDEKTIDAKGLLDIMTFLQNQKGNKSPLAIILATPDIASEIVPRKHGKYDRKKISNNSAQADIDPKLDAIELETEDQVGYEEFDEVERHADELEDKLHVDKVLENIEASQRLGRDSSSDSSSDSSENDGRSKGAKEYLGGTNFITDNSNELQFVNDKKSLSEVQDNKSHPYQVIKNDDNENEEYITDEYEPAKKTYLNTEKLSEVSSEIKNDLSEDLTEYLSVKEGQSYVLDNDRDINEVLNLQVTPIPLDDAYDYFQSNITDDETNIYKVIKGTFELEGNRRKINLNSKVLEHNLDVNDVSHKVEDITVERNKIDCENETDKRRKKSRNSRYNITYNFSFFLNRK